MRGRRSQHAVGGTLAVLALVAGLAAAPSGASPAPTTASPSTAGPAAASPAAARRATARDDAAKLKQLRAFLRARTTAYAGVAPTSPNPSLALLPPGVRPDYQGWAALAARRSAARIKSRAHQASGALGPLPGVTYAEIEGPDDRGFNDDTGTAEFVAGVGTGAADEAAATILGTMNAGTVPANAYRSVRPNKEDDGSFAKAGDLGVSNRWKAAKTTGYRGDAPGKGEQRADDFDFYRLRLTAGQQLTATVTKTDGNLRPAMALVDEDFGFVADTWPQFGKSATLDASVMSSGTYYLLVFGWWVSGAPPDGPTTGDYELRAAAAPGDPDTYAVDLEAGDVLAASLNVDGWVSILGPDDGEAHASNQDASFIYPASSPLPGARGSGLSELIAASDGRYYVQFSGGDGPYIGRLEVYRHGGEGAATPQKVYLDFDGARVNTGGWGGYGVVELSPMSKFLPRWGLDRSQEADVIAAITANVTENVLADLAANGLSDTVDVEITTSLDGPDISGDPGVTTIVVGGSIRESGVPTIGIAQSIDPGNFERTETGLVLLDVLSGPESSYGPASLNSYLTDESDRVAFVAQGVGNVTSHEIGHMIGNWHTDNTNTSANLMDAGGEGFRRLFGVGPDKIGGTADDRDVDFVQDDFSPFEGFVGQEDTRSRSTWAMSN